MNRWSFIYFLFFFFGGGGAFLNFLYGPITIGVPFHKDFSEPLKYNREKWPDLHASHRLLVEGYSKGL